MPKCAICGKTIPPVGGLGSYKCKKCGRNVCSLCISVSKLYCKECEREMY